MNEALKEKEHYLANFSRLRRGASANGHAALHRLRQDAIARFAELGFPTLRDEEWRFTNLAPLVKIPFQLAGEMPGGLDTERLARLPVSLEHAHRLVFVNGRLARELSALGPLPDGVVVASLAAVLDTHPDRVEPHLGRLANFRDQAFTALNTAFFQDGAFVHVSRGKVIEEPIHLVFLATAPGGPTVAHPRNLIVCAANSQATLIESYIGTDRDVTFTNAVTEILLEDNAILDHYKLVRESPAGFHVAGQQVRQERGSQLAAHALTLEGALVRNEVNVVLDGEGSARTLNGLYLGTGRQLIDNHTRIDHARPHCTSHELYKGILDGQAHGVFSGKIHVHPNAQKTDAKQTNQTLLLSEDAVINTKPQLEIYADDVKCTHGATIGQLAEEAIFYLRSRGIGRAEARSLLTYAFANDILNRIKVEALRAALEQLVLARQTLPAGRDILEAV